MNERLQYRVSFDDLEDVQIWLDTGSKRAHRCELGNISFGGVGCRVNVDADSEDGFKLEDGQEVTFRIESERVSEPLQLGAKVVHRTREDGHDRYGFLFTFKEDLKNIEPALYRVFNRRMYFRVQTDPKHPILVVMVGAVKHERVAGWAIDICEGGMGFGVQLCTHSCFDVDEEVDVYIWFRMDELPLALPAVIRSKWNDHDDRVHVGVEFNWNEATNARQVQKIIHDFVMERQRSVLREESKVASERLQKSA